MTQDEYIDLVLQVLKSNLDPVSGYVTAAVLGAHLRKAGNGVLWKDFGYKSLSALLQRAELEKRLRLVQSNKGALAVCLADDPANLQAFKIGNYNPLRKPIWSAFVMGAPAGRRFFNRKNGSVRLGLQASPSPVDDWVEIQPLLEAQQQEWARDFIAQESLAGHPEVATSLEGAHWHRDFPDALDRISRSLRSRWNRQRSREVSSAAENWALQHSISLDLVFQTGDSLDLPSEVSVFSSAGETAASSSLQREWILSAIATLPLEKLMEISLPAGLLLEAIANHSRGARG